MDQMLNTFLPTFLLWCLSYSTIFIEIGNFTDRFIGTVTALLVLVSLLSSVNDDLPKTSYFKFIDIWFLWYITNILLIIMYHIVVSRISNITIDTTEQGETVATDNSAEINRNKRQENANNVAVFGFATSTIAFIIIYFSLTT